VTDNTNLITELRNTARSGRGERVMIKRQHLIDAADALAARDTACGHLDNKLVAKTLRAVQHYPNMAWIGWTADDFIALRAAATFQVTE
jgi:hypothetical protein